MAKEAKTNAMRMLERAKVAYTSHEYPHEEGQAVDGANVARLTGQDPARVFKTLVTQGADRNYYVFVVPVLAELDLKKAAKAAGVKSVAMIHVADINKVTGYIRGGCSPVGMKKQFVTVYDESCLAQQTMLVSGGRIGTQVCCAPEYTLANLRFACAVEPDNAALQAYQRHCVALRAQQQPTLPSTLATEKAINPFLRTHVPAVVAAACAHAPQLAPQERTAVLAALRSWKNVFQ
mgnify:CR=1 FL=1